MELDGAILHRRRLDVRGVFHVRTLHRHTLETSVGVHAHLVRRAVVHPVFTLVDVWTKEERRRELQPQLNKITNN